jgi:hypothetical protein
MGILFRLNTPRARIIHSSSLTGLKWDGTWMCMGAGGDGPHIWAYLTNTGHVDVGQIGLSADNKDIRAH